MPSNDLIIRTVAEHRQHVGDARPYPPAGDCVLFAITEAGELIDAILRQTPRYLRNNARASNPAAEAGDLGYMIASAIDQIDRRQDAKIERPAVLTAQILDRLSYALIALEREQHTHARQELIGALETWKELCRRENWNPDNLIADVASRVNARWRAPAPDADLPTFVADEVRTISALAAAMADAAELKTHPPQVSMSAPATQGSAYSCWYCHAPTNATTECPHCGADVI